MNAPTSEVQDRAQAILDRADEVYEYLREKYHPDVPRHHQLHPELAYVLRYRAWTIAMLESSRG